MTRILWVSSALLLLAPESAVAHARLTSSTPADGGVLAADAKAIEMAFDGLIREASCVATDASGKAVSGFGAATFAREKLRVPITASPSAGAYTLTCKLKADLHEVTHAIKFNVK